MGGRQVATAVCGAAVYVTEAMRLGVSARCPRCLCVPRTDIIGKLQHLWIIAPDLVPEDRSMSA